MNKFYSLSLGSAIAFLTVLFSSFFTTASAQCTDCTGNIRTVNVDFSANPDGIFTLNGTTRQGRCCGAPNNENCIRFNITLNPDSEELRFSVANPAPPQGAAGYKIDCGPEITLGEAFCIQGQTSFCLLYCMPGGDTPTYTITVSRTTRSSDDVTIQAGCSAQIGVAGVLESSIVWNSIAPDDAGTYNGWLSATTAQDTVTVSVPAGTTYPTFVDYVVTGTSLGCAGGTYRDTIRVNVVPGIEVNITPQDALVCFGQTDVVLTANVTGGAPPYNYLWSNGETTQSITVGVGIYTVQITDQSTGCAPSQASVTVTEAHTEIIADAGADITVCANSSDAQLNGSVFEATGGIWSGGGGTFTPDNTTLNAVYAPTAGEITAGSVTLTLTTTGNGGCTPDSDQVTIFINPVPIVDAGSDLTVCANNPVANISGTISNPSATATWTTSGTGTFGDATSLSTTYTPSADDITAGTVTLTLTATLTGCNPVADQVVITISPAPVVDAGAAQTVCANNPTVTLAGTVSDGTATNAWTTEGDGAFSNASSLTSNYTPGAGDIAAGTVTLTLTSTVAGCNAVTDNVTITINPAPIVNAGADITVCKNNPNTTLSGTVTASGATTNTWSTSGTGAFGNANNLNTTYTPTAADVTAGSVTITLTSSQAGCSDVTDQLTITFSDEPVVDAGAAQTVCANNAVVTLSGTVDVAGTTNLWTTSGTGTFANASNLSTTYTPSADDITAGTVTLTLTATLTGCNPVADQVVITISPAPVVDAGAAQTVCANNPTVTLAGTSSSGTTTWSTSGDGTFSNASSLTSTYTAGANDITNGTVTLTLTSSLAGCNDVSDVVVITITPAPVVDAGAPLTACKNNPVVTLSGTSSSGTTTWSTSGDGTFSNASSLTSTYTAGANDITNGTVTLTLTSNLAGCNPVTDQVVITYSDEPVVDAGAAQTVCANNAVVTLSGTVDVAGTTNLWTTSGTGTFANASNLSTTYTPSADDITAGTVTLTLTATLTGCNPVADQVVITISPAPVVDVGAAQTVCANNPTVTLAGTVSNGTATNVWTTAGDGVFSNASSLTSNYTPGAGDIAAGTVTLTLTSTVAGCNAVSDNVTITITPAPIVNAGADITVCKNNPNTTLSGTVTATGATTNTWSTSGTGTFGNANNLNTTYTPSAADVTAGSVTITLTSSQAGCNNVTDQLTITFSDEPVVDAGAAQTVCANNAVVTLNGTVDVAGTTNLWTTSGTGTFANAANLSTTYTASADDITAGTVTLTLSATLTGCAAVTDQMTITFTPAPVVNAGADQSVCANNADVTLNGTVSSGTPTWSTAGDGTFDNNTSLTATYTPGATDISNGTVTLTLSSSLAGCNPVTDQMVITITPAPIVNAGVDVSVCRNNPAYTLSGTISSGSPTWSTSGDGSFNNPNNLNATYTPGANDLSTGSVTLTLTSSLAGCNDVSDQMTIIFSDEPIVNAGADQSVCANNAVVTLNGTVDVAGTTNLWTTNGTGTFANASNLSTTYTPSAADITAGTVTLTLSATLTGCAAVTDQMTITFTPAPVVNAGADQSVCSNNATVTLAGTVSDATATTTWSTTGTGTFGNINNLNTTYTPSATDITNGSVTIRLTASVVGCNNVSDQMTITITPAPIVDAGADTSLCKNDAVHALLATLTGTGTISWSSSGSGTFSNASILNPTYTPSATDLDNGSVTLTITVSSTGCLDVTDEITISYFDPPVVEAGSDQTICANNLLINLSGSVSGSTTTGLWTTSGTGTFSNDTDLNASFTPSQADIDAGTVTLTLNATGSCFAEDELVITFTPAPIVDAGEDQIVCEDEVSVVLSGSVTGGASQGEWTTLGDGSFSNPNDLNATYTFGTNDIATQFIQLVLTSTDNGNCIAVSDTVNITITSIPVVFAGNDAEVCANVSPTLSGTVTGGAGTGIWTTSGTGTFANATILNTTYNFSAADIAAGTVTFTLTSTNACQNPSDEVVITITPAPIVDAGEDQSVCETGDITISGTIGGSASQGVWTTTGTGTFADANSLSTTYTPSAADGTAGSIELILTTTDHGDCLPVSDTLVVTFVPNPTIFAGDDQTVCKTANVVLDAIVGGGATQVEWTTSGDGTFTDAFAINTVYIPGVNDTLVGSVTITVTTTDASPCTDVSDELTITFEGFALVDAGEDETLCANNISVITLNGSVSGTTTTGIWSTNGDGTFSNDTDLAATYTLGINDITNGLVEIYLNPTNAGACNTLTDTLVLVITPAPIVDAGGNVSICISSGSTDVVLNGSVTGGSTTGVWSTNGAGTFTSTTDLSTTYIPDAADITLGSIELYLTSTNNGDCLEVVDTITVTFDDLPVATANDDFVTCISEEIFVGGTVDGFGTVSWSSNGAGIFLPSNNVLDAQYIPDATDAGQVITFTLTYTNACGSVTDEMQVTINPDPIAFFDAENNCDDLSVQFSTFTIPSNYTFSWNFGDGNTSTDNNPNHTYAAPGTYTAGLSIETPEGCTASFALPVTVDDPAIAFFELDTTVFLVGTTIEFIDQSINASSLEWVFNISDTAYVADTVYTFNEVGEYTIKLTVWNAIGCPDSLLITIRIVSQFEPPVFPPTAPTAFTPNGDGNNDTFRMRGGPFKEYELRVFNHWGNQIFISTDPDVGWDGSLKDKQQPNGLYIYTFRGVTIDDNAYNFQGEITLIR